MDDIVGVLGVTFISLVGMKGLKLKDTTLGILGALSFTGGFLISAFATSGWMFYLGIRYSKDLVLCKDLTDTQFSFSDHVFVLHILHFTASGVQSFTFMMTTMARSLLSKLVSGSEVGKTFVVAGILETCVGLCGPPLYGLVYDETLSTLPNTTYFITSGLGASILLIFM